MSARQGIIVLMGSGELTATMVELHKSLLRPFGPRARACFIDTPAGFQLNVDQITQRAVAYFKQRVGHDLAPASFKSHDFLQSGAAALTFAELRKADYLLIGPGSPTYALSQWRQSPMPLVFRQHIEKGGCLVAASAAALTMGRLTLPVYEIYKVGHPPYWENGLDILGFFGLNLVVFPHWNNAEGGNHDTRYCFMGEQRLAALVKQMPPTTPILGIDEHTALVIDLAQPFATVHGIGRVVLRRDDQEIVFTRTEPVPVRLLWGETDAQHKPGLSGEAPSAAGVEHEVPAIARHEDLWRDLKRLAEQVHEALDQQKHTRAGALLLEMERRIWQARDLLEENDGLGAARELFREQLALMAARPPAETSHLESLVEALLALRATFRDEKKWREADALRQCLQKARVAVVDTPDGSRWTVAT